MANDGWNLTNKLALAGVVIAIVGIVVAFLTPELRAKFLPTNTDNIAGDWIGTIKGENDPFSTEVKLTIKAGCTIGNICGTISAPELSCSGNIILTEVNDGTFTFVEQNMSGTGNCISGGKEYLRLLPDGSLSWAFRLTEPSGQQIASNGALRHPSR